MAVPEQKADAMHYDNPFHLYNSAGAWIGICLGRNVFDTDNVWRGWFPWDSGDIVWPHGAYLGTVIGNRLYAFEHKRSLRVIYRTGYPPIIPLSPQRPKPAEIKKLPSGASDVDLRFGSVFPPADSIRQPRKAKSSMASRQKPRRKRTLN